jgi:uncharacterized membrane protein
MPLHLFVVHFPVALLVVGAAVDLIGTAAASPGLRRVAGGLLILGAFATLLAFATGGPALSHLLLSRPPGDPIVESHTQWGSAGLWVIAIAGAVRALWRDRLTGPAGWPNLLLALLSAAVVIGITSSGLAIRHG